MTALRALDAVARLGSISGAADELSFTRSAVSHQISALEQRLGFELTERVGRGVKLTPRGERYAREIERALSAVLRAGYNSQEPLVTGRLCVSCNTGFASSWLCQRIGSFISLYPLVQLHLVSPPSPADTTAHEADVFVTYGNGNWPHMQVTQLVDLHHFPVCSPQYLNEQGGLKSVEDLGRCTLLHMNDFTDWKLWLAATGRNDIDCSSGILFADAPCALSACMAGQGIAIGDSLLSSTALKRGLLVTPYDIRVRSSRGYYLALQPAKAMRPVVRAFTDWLIFTLAHDPQKCEGQVNFI
ncbi:LysR substrate-binding domain-containing protein [Pseudomonas sp. TE21394]